MKQNVAVRGQAVSTNIHNVSRSEKVAIAYSDWISTIPWNWFCTFTTPYELTIKSARRAMDRFFNRTQSMTMNPQAFFWVAEPFECKDGWHTHGLYLSDLPFKAIIEAYQITSAAKRNNTYARIHLSRYNARMAAAKYCAKYIMKRYGDYDLLIPSRW